MRARRTLTQLGARPARPDSPDEATLEAFRNPRRNRPYRIVFDCPEFTSMCPVTGQPDFGAILIEYVPAQACLESKSLKLYLGSFRQTGAFAESIANRVLDDLVKACRPRWMRVTASFTPRGGIAIRVVAEHGREPE